MNKIQLVLSFFFIASATPFYASAPKATKVMSKHTFNLVALTLSTSMGAAAELITYEKPTTSQEKIQTQTPKYLTAQSKKN